MQNYIWPCFKPSRSLFHLRENLWLFFKILNGQQDSNCKPQNNFAIKICLHYYNQSLRHAEVAWGIIYNPLPRVLNCQMYSTDISKETGGCNTCLINTSPPRIYIWHCYFKSSTIRHQVQELYPYGLSQLIHIPQNSRYHSSSSH